MRTATAAVCALFFGGDERTPDDAMAKIAIDEAKNGSICNLMKPREGTIVLLRYAARVHMDVIIVDGRVRRQFPDAFQHIFDR